MNRMANQIKLSKESSRPYLMFSSQRRVSSHQEVQASGRNQRRDQADQVVVHITRIPQSSSASGHDRRDERIDLSECRIGNAQTLSRDAVQSSVVQDDLKRKWILS